MQYCISFIEKLLRDHIESAKHLRSPLENRRCHHQNPPLFLPKAQQNTHIDILYDSTNALHQWMLSLYHALECCRFPKYYTGADILTSSLPHKWDIQAMSGGEEGIAAHEFGCRATSPILISPKHSSGPVRAESVLDNCLVVGQDDSFWYATIAGTIAKRVPMMQEGAFSLNDDDLSKAGKARDIHEVTLHAEYRQFLDQVLVWENRIKCCNMPSQENATANKQSVPLGMEVSPI